MPHILVVVVAVTLMFLSAAIYLLYLNIPRGLYLYTVLECYKRL